MTVLLGCIADDFTGATDLAGTLAKAGMRTVQTIGVPRGRARDLDADAIVVALKSRTVPAAQAVEASLRALEWLRAAGARQIVFKYCSTFDSTDEGNIGPVTEALLDALGADFTIACPAFPANGRLVFKGHLFVGDVLLHESGMQDHPLTPMTDPNLVRVLDRQTRGRVGLVAFEAVRAGAGAIRKRYQGLRADGARLAIVDATDEEDLRAIGEASTDLALVTGGSGVAIGLPGNFRRAGLLAAEAASEALPRVDGAAAFLAGSCSRATREQVANASARCPSLRIDPLALGADGGHLDAAIDFARARIADGPVLLYATSAPEDVRAAQEALGSERAGALVEAAMARLASSLVEAGVRRLVVAGGETSGAVVNALGVEGLRIGPEIDPGVPWTTSIGEPTIALALKSGNFGAPDFFTKALETLE